MTVPVHWQTKKLGELCEIFDSKRKPITKKDRIDGGIPYYGASGILSYVDNYIFDEDLVLLGEDGAKWKSGDKSAFKISGKTWVNNHAHVLKPIQALVDESWLVYYLNHEDLEKYVTGLTVPKLNQAKMRSIVIPIPPIGEQREIVAVLDLAFAKIDTALANVRQNIINADELFQSNLTQIFSNPGNGWQSKTLGELSSRVSVGHVGSTSEHYTDSKDGIQFIRSQNVRKGFIDISRVKLITPEFHQKLKKSQLHKNDILFVRVGANRGDCAVIKEDYGEINCANIVFARPTGISSIFLEYYFLSIPGRKALLGMSTGSAQGVVNTMSIKALSLRFPDEEEQNNIADRCENLQMQTRVLHRRYQKEKQSLLELKKSLLQDAFTGNLITNMV